jgi:hypothetical protein
VREMQAKLIAIWLTRGIAILVGLYSTLLGYRLLGRKPGENLKYDLYMQKYGNLFKIGGLATMTLGLAEAIYRTIQILQ